MPELRRIHKILDGVFLVVQDAFLTETARYADVVLPAALWGEKTGCVTNADRTVHLARKAIDPPGEARADLDILLDYARRMEFRDRAGQPLIKWHDAEGAFNAWRECSRGRPCDYSGLSYDKLDRSSGIQWPCTEESPNGTERLYTNGVFNTAADYCELYGHDLVTGGEISPTQYRASDPKGRAVIKPADYVPPPEEPDTQYPFWLSTGRVVYHWHTRTKTSRVPALQQAAPAPVVEMNYEDATRLSISAGERVRVGSRRGVVELQATLTDIIPAISSLHFTMGMQRPSSPRRQTSSRSRIGIRSASSRSSSAQPCGSKRYDRPLSRADNQWGAGARGRIRARRTQTRGGP